MADTVDQAQRYTETFDHVAQIAHMVRPKEQPPEHFDGVHCVDCEVEIPPKRIELVAAFRCVHCQGLHERR